MRLSRYTQSLDLSDCVAVCSLLTSKIVRLDRGIHEILVGGGDAGLSIRDRVSLLREQIVVDCPAQDEFVSLENDFERRRSRTGPLCLTITPGYGCNCSCPTCFQKSYDKTTRMSSEAVDGIIRFTTSQIERNLNPAIVVWYYGGEPLLYASLCSKITRALRSVGASHGVQTYFQVTTNGTKLGHGLTKTMLEVADQYYVSLAQSADMQNQGIPYRSGRPTYSDVLAGLAVLARHRKRIALRINVWNAETLEDDLPTLFRDLMDVFGGRAYEDLSFQFHERLTPGAHCAGKCGQENSSRDGCFRLTDRVRQMVPGLPWSSRHFVLAGHATLPTYRNGGCSIELCHYLKGEGFFIAPTGDFFLCNIAEGNPRHCMGNIARPEQALQHEEYERMLRARTSDDAVCRECRYLPLCMNRCPLFARKCAMDERKDRACQRQQADRVAKYIRHKLAKPENDESSPLAIKSGHLGITNSFINA